MIGLVEFKNRIRLWLNKKDFAVPFSIDGPGGSNLFNSGFFDFLDELQAFREGAQFHGVASDRRIFGLLTCLYGISIGVEAARRFAPLWQSKAEGESVPSLILSEIRELNALDDRKLTNAWAWVGRRRAGEFRARASPARA